ncbi:MAG: CRISPR-associated protein (Cas_NE0113) [Acidobacteria bacterium ADurb.Bin340]|nr:MAG: CRISPR-associated protein (Cas_NE0113) [Acidobacteria bacterium ADurb.Bin340]
MAWLISSLGTSPAVLSEALWFLERRKGLEVDRLTCIGTQASRQAAEQQLFAAGGALDRLRLHLGKPPEWLTEGHGYAWETEPLNATDNRDLEEARAMDRACRRAVREAQEQGDGPVVACISGGRKTMSSSLQQAMTLLARPEDWAFHVLLRVPEGQEEQKIQQSGFAFPGDPHAPQASGVEVDAFEIPLVRLRDLALGYQVPELLDEGVIQALQRAVNQASAKPRLRLNLRSQRLELAWGNEAFRPAGEALTLQQALMLGMWIVAGAAKRKDEFANEPEQVIERLSAHGIIDRGHDQDTLLEVVDAWLEGDKTFGPMKTELNRRILGLHPALERFTLKSRWGKGGPIGFADEVYQDSLITCG